MSDFKWSDKEKKIAKRAFEKALERELAGVLERMKSMAAAAQNPDDIWALNSYLTKQKMAIEEKYDYRYSQLILVFSQLLREKWIESQDLEGLSEEKINEVEYLASK